MDFFHALPVRNVNRFIGYIDLGTVGLCSGYWLGISQSVPELGIWVSDMGYYVGLLRFFRLVGGFRLQLPYTFSIYFSYFPWNTHPLLPNLFPLFFMVRFMGKFGQMFGKSEGGGLADSMGICVRLPKMESRTFIA